MIPILKIACFIDIAKDFLATPYSCEEDALPAEEEKGPRLRKEGAAIPPPPPPGEGPPPAAVAAADPLTPAFL